MTRAVEGQEDVFDAFAHAVAEVLVLTEDHASLEHSTQLREVDDHVGSLDVEAEHLVDKVK